MHSNMPFMIGEGGTVDIVLRGDADNLIIIVEDNGVGCPPDAGEGVGSRLIKLMAAHRWLGHENARATRLPYRGSAGSSQSNRLGISCYGVADDAAP
jgi:hypothetical protein